MVGTFYSASSPETPPFVKVGDSVDPDTVVCIIEAMKVMNEIKAGIAAKSPSPGGQWPSCGVWYTLYRIV